MSVAPSTPREPLAIALIRRLLVLYPRDFRRRYADEMVETFRARWLEVSVRGRAAGVAFLVRTAASVVGAAAKKS